MNGDMLSLFDNTDTRKLSEVANHHTGISPNWGRVQQGGCTHHMSCCCHWKLPQALFPCSPPVQHPPQLCYSRSDMQGYTDQCLCISSSLFWKLNLVGKETVPFALYVHTYVYMYMHVTISLRIHVYLQPIHMSFTYEQKRCLMYNVHVGYTCTCMYTHEHRSNNTYWFNNEYQFARLRKSALKEVSIFKHEYDST